MRGFWWSAIVISALLGGFIGAGLMFGLTQAFGGSSGGHTTTAVRSTGLPAGTTASLTSGDVARNGLDAAGIYARVRPEIVTINTTTVSRRSRDEGEGTGIVLDTNGHILTNNHVIDSVGTIKVTLESGQSYDAKVLTQSPDIDLAVIAITVPANLLHPATLGDATKLRVGEPVLALGNPLGYEATLTEGIVSGLDRTFDDGQGNTLDHLIQSDAAINPGNSGGPLLNGNGEVVGINTLLDNADNSQSFAGIGFAVSIETARDLIRQANKK
jgi:putative serine protease PepD